MGLKKSIPVCQIWILTALVALHKLHAHFATLSSSLAQESGGVSNMFVYLAFLILICNSQNPLQVSTSIACMFSYLSYCRHYPL